MLVKPRTAHRIKHLPKLLLRDALRAGRPASVFRQARLNEVANVWQRSTFRAEAKSRDKRSRDEQEEAGIDPPSLFASCSCREQRRIGLDRTPAPLGVQVIRITGNVTRWLIHPTTCPSQSLAP